MKSKFLLIGLVILLAAYASGCGVTKKNYYEIPKSEIVDVTPESKQDEADIPKEINDNNDSADKMYYTYRNERFGYAVEVPDYLKPGVTPENNDGLEFQSADGTVTLTVYGSNYPSVGYDVPNIDDIYTNELAEMRYTPKIAEKYTDGFLIAWDEYNTAYWKKYFLTLNDIENVLIISYPVSKENEYSEDVQYILDSFTMGESYDPD